MRLAMGPLTRQPRLLPSFTAGVSECRGSEQQADARTEVGVVHVATKVAGDLDAPRQANGLIVGDGGAAAQADAVLLRALDSLTG